MTDNNEGNEIIPQETNNNIKENEENNNNNNENNISPKEQSTTNKEKESEILTPLINPELKNQEEQKINTQSNNMKILQGDHLIKIRRSKIFGIPYFIFGNTVHFYFICQKIPSSEMRLSQIPTPPFTLGSCKTFFSCFILGMIGYLLVTLAQFYLSLSIYIRIIIISCFAFYLITGLLTFFLNPGVEYCDGKSENKNYCQICNFYYPSNGKKIEHCDVCQVCVRNWDHHCGVIGKCIGRRNLFFFYAYLVAGCLEFMLIMVVMMDTAVFEQK